MLFETKRETGGAEGGVGSDSSPRSSEGSPEGAASTLLAPPHRDPDQEEGSRTLVLISAANGAGSPGNGLVSPCDGQGTLAALTPQGERPVADESEPGTLSSVLKSEPRPIIATSSGAASICGTSSPPFMKVERTFVHIAETTHLNIMTTRLHQLPGMDEEPLAEEAELRDQEGERETAREERKVQEREGKSGTEDGGEKEEDMGEKDKRKKGMDRGEGELVDQAEEREHLDEEEQTSEGKQRKIVDVQESQERYSPAKEVKLSLVGSKETQAELEPGVGESTRELAKEEAEPDHEEVEREMALKEKVAPVTKRPTSAVTQRRSRIPVLMSEEETGSDRSSQTSQEQSQQRRGRRPRLARLVLERRQSRLRAQSTSSPSPTLSTTGSEDDTHQSDDSGRPRGRDTRARSRIPRPVAPAPKLCVRSRGGQLPWNQRSVSFVQPSSVSSSMPKSASAHASIHQQQPRPQLRPSKTLPPRTPTSTTSPVVRTAARSLSRPKASTSSTVATSSPRSYSASPQPLRPRPLSASQSKSKAQDSHKKSKPHPPSATTTGGPKGKSSETKAKSR